MLTISFILGWQAAKKEQPEYQMNIFKQQLKLKENELTLLMSTLESKRKIFEDSIQKLKLLDYKYNSFFIKIINHSLNDSDNSEEYQQLKKSIHLLIEPDDLINKIINHSFKIEYVKENRFTISKDKFKEIIELIPELIKFIQLTDFKYYKLKPAFNLEEYNLDNLYIILDGCKSFKYWEIYCIDDTHKPPSTEGKDKPDKHISNFINTCREFYNYSEDYIHFYNECLKYIEEYYKQTKQNDSSIIKIMNDYINESMKLIQLYERKSEILLNTGGVGIYINKILDDYKNKVFNNYHFKKLKEFELNINTKLNETKIIINEQIDRITRLSIIINQFESDIYENKIENKILIEYKKIQLNLNQILDYTLKNYEQSIINNRLLLLEIEKCFTLRKNYDLEKECKDIEKRLNEINKEIEELKWNIEYKRLECIYGTL